MNIHIVGAGVVGKATGKAFERFGHSVVYTDKGDDHGAVRADVHFICVPEQVAPECVRQVAAGVKARKPTFEWEGEDIVIRSTVPPGTTLALAKELRLELLHNPEFLREATAEQDVMTADRVLIGVTLPVMSAPSRLHTLYEPFRVPIYVATSTETELAKLLTNAYLATLISFWNEANGITAAAGVNGHKVARLAALDSRVSSYGYLFLGQAYGGKCLPKDVAQLLAFAKQDASLRTWLLSAVQDVNIALGGR